MFVQVGGFCCCFYLYPPPKPNLFISTSYLKRHHIQVYTGTVGVGSCRTASCKQCHCLAAVTPLGWLIDSRSGVKHGSVQGTARRHKRDSTESDQISSEMSRRAITLLLSCMRWLVIQPVCVCSHIHTFSHVGY